MELLLSFFVFMTQSRRTDEIISISRPENLKLKYYLKTRPEPFAFRLNAGTAAS
jgi:hypothetical protein